MAKTNQITRRLALKGAASTAALLSAAAFPVMAGTEQSIEKVRRLGKELSAALAECGEHEYAYVRPEGVEFPVLFANRSQPSDLANFYFREYQEAVSSEAFKERKRHIRQIAYLLSSLMTEGTGNPEYILVRPQSVGDWAVSEYHTVDLS